MTECNPTGNESNVCERPVDYTGWQAVVAKYSQPSVHKAVWQLINSFGGFFLGWILMFLSLPIGYWLTLLLAVPTAGCLVRIFIIQHDCGHGSFFKLRHANDTFGMICSLLTMIPYRYWRKSHAVHHAHHAELEERGIGDVWTLTVDEYRQASWWTRLCYRTFRNPFFLFGFAPTLYFVFLERVTWGMPETWRHGERASVWWTNLGIAAWIAAAIWLMGLETVLAIQVPVTIIASGVGVWMFYVQHQFERTYWEHTSEWDYTLAAMHGSSYYQLPRILQWFTGNIGYHHIHHLSPRIPNYNLQQCHDENPLLQRVTHLTFWSSLKTVKLVLWDEEQRRLVTFREGLQAQVQ